MPINSQPFEPEATLTLRELNRATLARQMLLRREAIGVVEAVERLAGMQAQYSPSPYIGLWSRLMGFRLEDLTDAILDRRVVKATLMRWTLHLASARDYPHFTTATGDALAAASLKEAGEAGLHIPTMHKALLEFVSEPRGFAQLVDFANEMAGDAPRRHNHLAWRWAHAPGWLVHVPPSGTWRSFGSNSYVSAHEWLGQQDVPSLEDAVTHVVRRYLAAFGPATRNDVLEWSGLRRVAQVDQAIQALGDEIVVFKNEEGKALYDLRDAPRPGGDVPAPVRYLPKWDNLLLAHNKRDRVLPDRYRKIIIKGNGDVTPTFLVDGVVAGWWSTTRKGNSAVLSLEALEPLDPATISQLEDEGEKLIRFVEPEAEKYEVRITG